MISSQKFPTTAAPAAQGWDKRPEKAAIDAISRFGLATKGWKGFDEMPWVQQLRKDIPEAFALASTCSSHKPEYLDQTHDLFANAQPQDRGRLQDYFAGKLGLEELSCRRSGAGAGLCDKRAAFYRIHEIGHEYANPAPREGLYL